MFDVGIINYTIAKLLVNRRENNDYTEYLGTRTAVCVFGIEW